MTLSSTIVKKQYAGDDSTVAFPTTFIFWDNTDIEVISLVESTGVETTWVEGTQYTLTGGDGLTGTVTAKTTPTDYTPATGETLTIRSNLPDTQGSAMPLGGAFPSTTVEEQFDKNVRLTQQRSEEISRAIVLPKTTGLSGIELPAPVAGSALVWNDAEDGLDNAVLVAGTVFLDEDDMASDSNTQGVTQQSLVAWVTSGIITMVNKVLRGCHLQADDGTEVLDPGTDGTDAVFTGDVTGDLAGNADTATISTKVGVLNVKVVDIGDWDMDATANLQVAHGLDHTKIRLVSAMVRNDSGTGIYQVTPGSNSGAGHPDVYIAASDAANIGLTRLAAGSFDNAAFASTSYNRGWVTIWYID